MQASFRARFSVTFKLFGHMKSDQIILAHNETCFKQNGHKKAKHITTKQGSFVVNLPVIGRVFWQFGFVFLIWHVLQILPEFVFFVDDVQNVAEVNQSWRGHKDDLENPESHVGNREGMIEA